MSQEVISSRNSVGSPFSAAKHKRTTIRTCRAIRPGCRSARTCRRRAEARGRGGPRRASGAGAGCSRPGASRAPPGSRSRLATGTGRTNAPAAARRSREGGARGPRAAPPSARRPTATGRPASAARSTSPRATPASGSRPTGFLLRTSTERQSFLTLTARIHAKIKKPYRWTSRSPRRGAANRTKRSKAINENERNIK